MGAATITEKSAVTGVGAFGLVPEITEELHRSARAARNTEIWLACDSKQTGMGRMWKPNTQWYWGSRGDKSPQGASPGGGGHGWGGPGGLEGCCPHTVPALARSLGASGRIFHRLRDKLRQRRMGGFPECMLGGRNVARRGLTCRRGPRLLGASSGPRGDPSATNRPKGAAQKPSFFFVPSLPSPNLFMRNL